MDEPFTGFDPINADLIKDEIKNLKSKGTTILYSTHRMESVEEICDNICLINRSKKILDGSIKDVKAANSKDHFELIMEGNTPDWVEIISKNDTENGHTQLVFKVENMNRAEIIKRLANEVNIWSFKELVPTIHQIFIDKVKEVNNA